jgi:diacylglycerol kinase (ATP)
MDKKNKEGGLFFGSHTMLDSFNAAIEGFLYVVKTQRNMRIHFLFALAVILLGILLNFTRIELMILCITVGIVLISEMVNTAVELMVNYVESSHVHWVKRVKDVSAGAVLIAAINAVVVGYFLFFRNNIIYQIFKAEMLKVSQSEWHVSFVIFLLLIGIVIIGKTFFGKGKPLRGGMPSGHAAIAFSVWMLVAMISQNSLLIFAVFILAYMIAQGRVGRNYHTVWEVFIGALTGIVITVMIYRLLTG